LNFEKEEKKLYVHYATERVYSYITEKVTVDDFLLNFARGTPVPSVQAIISHHTGTPLALVPLFHGGNVPVKSLSVYIAHCPTIFWE